MMRFVDNDPMRSACVCAEFLHPRQKAHKQCWPIRKRHAEQINAEEMFHGIQHFQHFGYSRHTLWAAQRYKPFELIVVALWIEQAHLIFLLDQPFDDRGDGCGFASAGWASNCESWTIGFHVKLAAI